jgi:hypothetical protein
MAKKAEPVVDMAKDLGMELLKAKEELDHLNVGAGKDRLVKSTVMINELEKELLDLLYRVDDLHKDVVRMVQLLTKVYEKVEAEQYKELKGLRHELKHELDSISEHFELVDRGMTG